MSSGLICGYISLLYSVADKPLDLWSKHVSLGGKIHRVSDDTLHGDKVIEILGFRDSVVSTSITAPAKIVDTLNIKLAVLVLVVKNLKSYFKLEVQITDKEHFRRRFSFMTYNLEKLPNVNASVARIPLKLEDCWNTLEINLQTLCRMVYGTDYEALQRIIVYPNCRLRRVYLQDRHYDHNEMPVELCNAFFNTYMSKWGINFVEKTSQTEECYAGSSKKRDSNRLASNNNTVSPTKAVLSEDADKTDKLERLNAFGAIANSLNPKTLKRNYVSSDTLNSKAKMRSNQNVIERRNWSREKLLTNEAMGSKLKENSNNIAEKWGNRNKEMTHEIWNANPFLKLNHMMQPASSVETSQSLKMHVDKTLCQKKSEFPKRLYPYRIRDSEDTSVTQRCNLNTITNISFGMSVANSPLVFKHSLSGNIGLNRDQTSNDKRAKKKANSTNGTRSLVTIEESVEDNCVPHLIEKEARPKNAKVPR